MSRVKNKLNWQCYSNSERNEAIEGLKDKIALSGGYIINFNMFSDMALSLTIEIEAKDISALYHELKAELNITEELKENLDVNSNKEWWILLNLSFGKGEGRLTTEIPNVPG